MKKLGSIFISLLLVFVALFGIVGCNAGTQSELQGKIDDLQAQLEEMEDRLAGMNEQIRERDAVIDDLNEQIRERDDIIDDLNDRIKNRDERIENLEKELGDKTPAEESAEAFYTLQEAYDSGWLTKEDLMSIAYYKNGGRRYNEDIMPEDYAPQSKTSKILSEDVVKSIKKVWAEKYNEDHAGSEKAITEEIVDIKENYGTYNDCPVLSIDRGDMLYADYYAPYYVVIAGVVFHYNWSDPRIIVWRG